jgi:hypothetical protein
MFAAGRRASKHQRVLPKDSRGGLRHFSLKVCEKVQEKSQTTYAEVADELVSKISAQNRISNPNAAPAPVRRRSRTMLLLSGHCRVQLNASTAGLA